MLRVHLTDFIFLQVEEEPESRGGRRRTWDDEHVLKRQFSALVPAFDPRPGRTNIAQTQDVIIPAPGKGLAIVSKGYNHDMYSRYSTGQN